MELIPSWQSNSHSPSQYVHYILWKLKKWNKAEVEETKQTNSVALSPRANYTDWSTATCQRNLMSTFVDRGVSLGQRGGSPTVVNAEVEEGLVILVRIIWSEFGKRKLIESNMYRTL
jgi:hypothetical protein